MFRWTLVLLVIAVPAFAQTVRDDMWVTNGWVNASTVSGNTLYIGGTFNRIGPSTGGFMPTDPASGVKLLPSLGVDGNVNAIAADGSGGFIFGGSFQHVMGVARANLARVDASGALTSWDPGVNGIVRAIAVGGGRVYIGGDFTMVGGWARTNAAAMDLVTGSVTSTWAPNPTLPVHYIGYLNSLVYMGGEFFNVAGTQRAHAGSFDAVSGAASNWQPNPDGNVYAMALRYDVINLTTSVYMGGSFTVCGGQFRKNFALVDATPNAPTFSTALNFDPSPDGVVRVIRTVGNTIPAIYVGGEFQNIAGNARHYIARFSGTTLSAFNPSPDGKVFDIVPSGSNLYVGGSFTTIGGTARSFAALITNSTGVVQAWDAAPSNTVRAFGLTATTTWIGGDFTTINAQACSNLAAIDLSTGAATTWRPQTNGAVIALEAIGNFVYVGGQFTSLGGQGHINVGRVDLSGNADGPWNPVVAGPVYTIAGGQAGTIYLGGAFTAINGIPRNRIAAVTDQLPPTVLPFNPNAGTSGSVNSIAVDGSNIYLAGTFQTLAGSGVHFLGKVDVNGALLNWVPNPTQPVNSITLTPTTVYAGFAGTNTFNGGVRYGAAELNKDIPTLTTWFPGGDPNSNVVAIRRSGNTVYMGGFFHNLGGQPREMFGAVDAVSGVATSFAPGPWCWLIDPSPVTYYQAPYVLELEEVGGQLYAVGQFTSIGGKPHSGVAGLFESTVDVPSVAVPGLALRAFPNPARGEQTFSFSAGNARLLLYDASGRLVRSFPTSGLTRVVWDGLSGSGRPVPPGLYFARLESGTTTKVLRVDH